MAKKPRITVLQTEEDVPLDRFEQWWIDAGLRLSVVELWHKDVPNLPAVGDGLVMLGGRMNALSEHRHPWLAEVKDLIADAFEIDTPILGICLGHQVLADTLGGEVTVGAPDGEEFDALEIEFLEGAISDPALGAMARLGNGPVPLSHGDIVSRLPEGAVELARSAKYPNQAFRLGSALGVQFHPEASPELMQHWWDTEHGGHTTRMLDRMRQADDRITPACRALAEGFAGQVRGN